MINKQSIQPEWMCLKCNRNTSGCDRVRLRSNGVFVASMHAQCAFDLPRTEDVIAEPVEPMKKLKQPMKKSHRIAVNAAQITLSCAQEDAHCDLLNLMDEIVKAAVRLNKFEQRKRFAWEQQKNDWESVCVLIARFLLNSNRAPKRRHLRMAIGIGEIK